MDDSTDAIETGENPGLDGTENCGLALSPSGTDGIAESPDGIESPTGIDNGGIPTSPNESPIPCLENGGLGTLPVESQRSPGPSEIPGISISSSGRYATKRKLNVKSIETKYEAILAVERGLKRKSEIAKDLCIPSNTLSSWLKCADKIKHAYLSSSYGPERKKMRTGNYEDVEQAVYKWYVSAKKQNLPMTGTILKQKAGEIAARMGETNFKCSTGWLDRFKGRYAISFKNCKDLPCNSRNQDFMYSCNYFASLLAQFTPNDIYNVAETGLLYRLLPDKREDYKMIDCSGGQNSEERLTVLVCTNMTGTDKLPLFVIGKEETPTKFDVESLPVEYMSNEKVFMTAEMFTNWILKLDSTFYASRRNVAFIVNKSPVHPKIDCLKAISLVYLPPNAAAKTQPLNQGILHHLKVQYRNNLIGRQSGNLDFAPTIVDGIFLLAEAWHSIRPAKIAGLFKQYGFQWMDESETDSLMEDEDITPNSSLSEFYQMLDEYAQVDDNIPTCETPMCFGDLMNPSPSGDNVDRFYTDMILTSGSSMTNQSSKNSRHTTNDKIPYMSNFPVTDISADNVMTMRNINAMENDHSNETNTPSRSRTVPSATNAAPSTMDAMQACVTLRAYLEGQENTSDLLEGLAKISDCVMKVALLEHQSQLSSGTGGKS